MWVLVLAGGSGQGQGGWAGRGCLGGSSRAVAKMPWLMRGGMEVRTWREERLVIMSVLCSCGLCVVLGVSMWIDWGFRFVGGVQGSG